jgi:uncharacterized metal-binding protein YceD (DUF177 family)
VGKFDIYKIPLKDLAVGTHSYEYVLDNVFFKDIDDPEVQKGKVNVLVLVKKNAHAFEIGFDIKGIVQIPCDRCLDDMDQEIDYQTKLTVKFGKDYAEEGDDVIIIPEAEGEINLAWFLYEFIALNIPMRHVHPVGKCSKGMVSKLRKHITTDRNEEEWDEDESIDFTEDNDKVEEKTTDPRWDGLKELIDNN